MDFQTLANNAIAVKKEVEELVDLVTNQQHKTTLNNFYASIKKLLDFLNDNQNSRVLCEHDKKAVGNKNKTPLDILCNNILSKLSAVEPLLVCSIFDYMRPENQPTTNERNLEVFPNNGWFNSRDFNNLITS